MINESQLTTLASITEPIIRAREKLTAHVHLDYPIAPLEQKLSGKYEKTHKTNL